jgi:8-oxo-dGTP pyrophosphatase MutT (NUDIX family)
VHVHGVTPHEHVRALLDGHPPVDDREAASIDRIRRELGRLDAPFDQGADLVHVTGSAIVVGPRGVLLLVHRKLGFWMQPGGHLEPGEDPATAAAREAVEETGIVVAHPAAGPCFVHADVHEAAASHVHLDLRFLLHAAADDVPRPPPAESQQVRWFAWDDASAVADDSLRGALVVARDLTSQGPRPAAAG